MASPSLSRDRLLCALWFSHTADALSMPLHWYYDVDTARQQYGTITTYEAPNSSFPHPDSNVYFSDIDPEVEQRNWPFKIFHNHPELFRIPGTHYHHGMAKGDNTLNARLNELTMRHMIKINLQDDQEKASSSSNTKAVGPSASIIPYDVHKYSSDLVHFLTTPGMHPDVYICSALRYFFSQLAEHPNELLGNGYNDPCISGLTLLIPIWLILARTSDRDRGKQVMHDHLFLTHASPLLESISEEMQLLVSALTSRKESSPESTVEAAKILRRSLQQMVDAQLGSENAPTTCGVLLRKKAKTKAVIDSSSAASAAPPSVENTSTHDVSGTGVESTSGMKANVASSSQSSTLSTRDQSVPSDKAYLLWKATTPAGKKLTIDEIMGMTVEEAFAQVFSVRCYAERSLPGAIYLALHACTTSQEKSIAERIRESLVRNTNLLGDNCHRGMLLGMLLGLVFGGIPGVDESITAWKQGLRATSKQEQKELEQLFQQFADLCTRQSRLEE